MSNLYKYQTNEVLNNFWHYSPYPNNNNYLFGKVNTNYIITQNPLLFINNIKKLIDIICEKNVKFYYLLCSTYFNKTTNKLPSYDDGLLWFENLNNLYGKNFNYFTNTKTMSKIRNELNPKFGGNSNTLVKLFLNSRLEYSLILLGSHEHLISFSRKVNLNVNLNYLKLNKFSVSSVKFKYIPPYIRRYNFPLNLYAIKKMFDTDNPFYSLLKYQKQGTLLEKKSGINNPYIWEYYHDLDIRKLNIKKFNNFLEIISKFSNESGFIRYFGFLIINWKISLYSKRNSFLENGSNIFEYKELSQELKNKNADILFESGNINEDSMDKIKRGDLEFPIVWKSQYFYYNKNKTYGLLIDRHFTPILYTIGFEIMYAYNLGSYIYQISMGGILTDNFLISKFNLDKLKTMIDPISFQSLKLCTFDLGYDINTGHMNLKLYPIEYEEVKKEIYKLNIWKLADVIVKNIDYLATLKTKTELEKGILEILYLEGGEIEKFFIELFPEYFYNTSNIYNNNYYNNKYNYYNNKYNKLYDPSYSKIPKSGLYGGSNNDILEQINKYNKKVLVEFNKKNKLKYKGLKKDELILEIKNKLL